MRTQAYARIDQRTEGRRTDGTPLPGAIGSAQEATMWRQPYLETCCRSALHRLVLSGAAGRPPGLKDGPCLARLTCFGFAEQRADGRYGLTEAGQSRHTSEILKLPAD